MLYKIIPDELPSFNQLLPVKITDYVPSWKQAEDEAKARYRKLMSDKKPTPEEPLTGESSDAEKGKARELEKTLASHKPAAPMEFGFVYKETDEKSPFEEIEYIEPETVDAEQLEIPESPDTDDETNLISVEIPPSQITNRTS